MSEASHPNPSSVSHYDLPEDRVKRRTASFGVGAICIVLLVAAGVFASKLSKQNATVADLRAQLERANSETAAVKADLAKANAKSADLQSQLNQATRQQADLQAEVKKTQELGSGLQSQLDQSRSDLRSQQEKIQAQMADLQAQLSRANATSSGLRKELAQAKSQGEDLKTQLARAKDDAAKVPPAVVKARALPLTTEFKKAFFGSTFTLQIKNPGADPLKLDIQITGSDKTPSRAATVEGGGTLKIEGLVAGANVVVASDGFESLLLTVP